MKKTLFIFAVSIVTLLSLTTPSALCMEAVDVELEVRQPTKCELVARLEMLKNKQEQQENYHRELYQATLYARRIPDKYIEQLNQLNMDCKECESLASQCSYEDEADDLAAVKVLGKVMDLRFEMAKECYGNCPELRDSMDELKILHREVQEVERELKVFEQNRMQGYFTQDIYEPKKEERGNDLSCTLF